MDYPLERTIDDTRTIHLKRIKAGSLFKLIATAVFSVLVPLIVFFGVLALFGFRTIHVNFHPVFGMQGLLASLVLAPLSSLFFSVIAWIAIYLGIFVRSFFGPISIVYVPARAPKIE